MSNNTIHMRREAKKKAYRHNLPPLPNHPPPRIHINHSTVQTPSRLLNQPRHDKHPRPSRNIFQHLPRPISSEFLPLRRRQPTLNPLIPGPRRRVSQIHRSLEILQELVPAVRLARTHCGPEVTGTRVSTQIGLWEEQDVHTFRGGRFGDLFEGGQCRWESRLGA